MITSLDRVVPAEAGKPVRAGMAEDQQFARSVALSSQAWTRDRARAVATRFDELAANWDAERGEYRRAPLADALARGGVWRAGPCIEVGSGTGLLTPLLAEVWHPVACVDLSQQMLRRSRYGMRVRADAAHLPVADGIAAAVVVGDAPLPLRSSARWVLVA
ncbi:MAG: class I SAM-dependent methyltransferase [Actinomycetota bacterium]|nr:class I SAM-dependent methyltransferase [Actinomycetota bacterium]